MANYLYKTALYKAETLVIDKPASNDADRTDFETNYKTTAIKVNEIILAETTVVVEKTYAGFKALIDGVLITWTNVKYLDNGKYELNLLSGIQL